MQTESPVPIESRALGTLTYIRASIESAGSLAVPGMAGIVMGSIGVIAAVLASMPALASHWLEIWLLAAVAALGLGGAVMARQATQRQQRYLGPVRKFLLCLCPALAAGAVLTFVMWRAGSVHLVPGPWLLLYGCAVLSASTVTSAATMRLIVVMGALFAMLGLTAFQLPPRSYTLVLGLGFGGLHLLFGILIGRASHGD
jgi:hypothetical protein